MKHRIALAALASMIAAPAFAADLGGNCCADLEERIAELEATTARKGNRRVSLTISGHINEAIFAWWSDPVVTPTGQVSDDSGLHIATNNHSRSRFRFTGSANIDAEWSAGFLLEVGVRQTNNSQGGNFNQFDANEKSGLDVRHEALYIDSKRLGRVWIGHTGSATEGITEICVGCGVANSLLDSAGTLGGFATQDAIGAVTGRTQNWMQMASSMGSQFSSGEGDRRDILMYVSPALMGFTVSAAIGSDKFYDVALRYAGEFNGVRIAAGIGYQKSEEQGGFTGVPVAGAGAIAAGGSTAAKGFASGCVASAVDRRVDCEALGLSVSAMHVPTGLYLRGSWGKTTDNNNNLVVAPFAVPTGGEDKSWYITGGINRKFHALGATNFWGEYGKAERGIGLPVVPVAVAGNIINTSSEIKWYGVGVQQTIDAAAMDVYLYYKHYEGENTYAGLGSFDVNDLDVVVLGAMIKF